MAGGAFWRLVCRSSPRRRGTLLYTEKFMKGRTVFFACAAAVAASLFGGCFQNENAVAKKVYNQVEVAKPVRRTIEIWDEYTARLEGEKAVEIRSRVSGYLEKIRFKDGDFVKAGSVLFEIDPRPFKAVVDANKATVREVEAKIELAKNNLRRAEELFISNAISKEVLETRKSEVNSQQALLMSAKAKLQEAQLNLEFTKITSPISGYVSRRMVDEGNLVNASTTLMATVVSRDTIYAYFDISERDVIKYTNNGLLAKIDTKNRQGPPVKLTLMDEKEPSHFGKLTYVDNALESSSIGMRADIDNADGKLLPGMYASILLRGGDPQECILVPESAVDTDLVDRFVRVVNAQNKVEYRVVEVGELVNNMLIITAGLDGTENIVVNGIQRAEYGKTVEPIFKEIK